MIKDRLILLRMTAIDPAVKSMVLATPDFSIGDKVHGVFVNKLEGATPGRHTEFLRQGALFIDIFFPHWAPIPYTSDISRLTGLDDSWWSDFTVAVLCQSMDTLTHDLQPQLKHSDISSAVSDHNAILNARAASLYSYIFSRDFSDFSIPFNAIDHNTAKAQYEQVLKDGVGIHELWFSEGMWKNPDWEMFHHFVKLMALGASTTEIDQLIDELRSAGLTIPIDVDKGKWTSFSGYLQNHPNVDHTDIDASASDGILRSEYVAAGEGGSFMNEENSFEFTANSQPGNKYRNPPGGGSCLSKGTQVLMSDLSLKPIENVQSGDWVATPTGPREVALVSTPLRHGRPLYSFNGLSFRFTGSHPFVYNGTSDNDPKLQSVSPEELTSWVPTLSRGGVARIESGTKLVRVHPTQPAQTETTVVEKLQIDHADELDDEILYDVILRPTSSGTFEYVVGTTDDLYLVASEIPLASTSPYATYAVLEMLATSLPVALHGFASTKRKEFHTHLSPLRLAVSTELLYNALSTMKHVTLTAPVGAIDPIEVYVSRHMQSFVTAERQYHWMAGGLYEMLVAAVGEEVEAAIELGWRSFGEATGDSIAISIVDLHLDHDYPVALETRLRLVVRLMVGNDEKEAQTVLDVAGRANTRFVRCFDQVTYFMTKWPQDEIPRMFLFDVFVEGDQTPLFTARTYLPYRLQPPYRRFAPWVHTADGGRHGRLFFDVRLLSPAAIEQEKTRASSWQEESKLHFAPLLGWQMGSALNTLMTKRRSRSS